jgi:hypothetical protein
MRFICDCLQCFLALGFLSEGLLLVFHLKGPRVEIMVHLILVLQVFATGARRVPRQLQQAV